MIPDNCKESLLGGKSMAHAQRVCYMVALLYSLTGHSYIPG